MTLKDERPMQEFTSLQSWITKRRELKAANLSLGFVPTMGALHDGHLSLLHKARNENDIVVLSIYVNSTQFDNKDDFNRYPITIDKDRTAARNAEVDFLLLPTYSEVYPDDYRYKVSEREFSNQLCGAHRPGHFDGVLTVVMKLLNLVQANRAYFGEKDYQQLRLLEGMAKAFFMETEIIGSPTLRETDGLAMSSRNVNLSPEARAKAPLFYQALKKSATADEARASLSRHGFEVDYVEDIEGRRFGAVKLGGVRLIDNVKR